MALKGSILAESSLTICNLSANSFQKGHHRLYLLRVCRHTAFFEERNHLDFVHSCFCKPLLELAANR